MSVVFKGKRDNTSSTLQNVFVGWITEHNIHVFLIYFVYMQKLTVTLQLSDEEVDTLGHAVEVALKYYIKEQAGGNKKFIFNDDLDDLRAIMYGLTNCGYHLWMNADSRASFPRGRLTIDVDAWIEHEKKLLKVRDTK